MTDEGIQPARVHVTFGQSAAGSLMMALKTLGRNEVVLGLVDDLSFGPISRADRRTRAQWNVDQLGFEEDLDLVAHDEDFWRTIRAMRTEVVVWMSSRDVREYCGLLDLLCEVREASVRVVDVSEVEFVGCEEASGSFGSVPNAQIVATNLIDRGVLVSSVARDAYRLEWQRLQNENAAVRVLTSTGLVSAPISYFDETILSFVTSEWQRCARVIGNSIGKLSTGQFRQITDDQFLFSRLLTLMDEEVVEGKNDQELWSMRDSWVRRIAVEREGP